MDIRHLVILKWIKSFISINDEDIIYANIIHMNGVTKYQFRSMIIDYKEQQLNYVN